MSHADEHKSPVAIVTGASRGIGRAVALQLSADGFSIAVNYASNEAAAAEVVEQIVAAGGSAFSFQADVADEVDIEALFARTVKEFGGVDVVVNSAGRNALSPIIDLDLDALDALHRTNIRGAFVVARQAARSVRDGGSVVMLSTSVVGLQFPSYAGYAASKGAVEAMTLAFARELRGRGITVNAVAPGPVATEFFFDGKSEAQIDQLTKQPPLERLGEPQDIANVISFLVGERGHWVNGQVVRANGGII